jgi:hypothetical protein
MSGRRFSVAGLTTATGIFFPRRRRDRYTIHVAHIVNRIGGCEDVLVHWIHGLLINILDKVILYL